MTRALTITKEVHFGRAKRGRKVIEEGADKKAADIGRIPRVTPYFPQVSLSISCAWREDRKRHAEQAQHLVL